MAEAAARETVEEAGVRGVLEVQYSLLPVLCHLEKAMHHMLLGGLRLF